MKVSSNVKLSKLVIKYDVKLINMYEKYTVIT